jgi:hypothetical protein
MGKVLKSGQASTPPQNGQTGLPSLSAQRTLQNIFSASASDMRNTCASVRVLAAGLSKKCWDITTSTIFAEIMDIR